MTVIHWLLIVLLLIVILIVAKRIYHKKKKIILDIGPSLKDKGGMVTVMEQIENSRLKEKYNIKHISTYKYKRKVLYFIPAIFKILLYKVIYRIDLAHIHMASYGSFLRKSIIINILKLLRIKVILHVHGSCFDKFYEESNNKLKKYIEKTLNKADYVIVLSESWKDFIKKFVLEEKIFVLYNSVNMPKLEEKEDNECKNILFLGRLGERKGVYDILKVAKSLEKENIKITLAGDGEIEKVKNIVKKEKLQNIVEIKEWVNGKEKEKLLKQSDIYILPSYNEGMPMSVLEAMSYSLPVITTNIGGIPEVINDSENGILIEPGDIDALKENILKLIKDKKLREKLGENATKTIEEKFNLTRQIDKLEELYLNLKYKKIKVCLTSSSGGHFMQLKQLLNMTEKYNTFIITEKNSSSKDIVKTHKVNFLMQQERKSLDFIFKFIVNLVKTFFIMLIKNPDIVISTGAGVTTFVCFMTKILGGKVIFIESFAKIITPTITGKIVYKFADEFYVQWEEMKKIYPKAKYEGRIY